MGEECRICEYYAQPLNRMHEEFASDSISFVGLFPNKYSTESGIANFRSKYKIQFPIKREFFGTKAKAFDVKVTPEVVVYDHALAKIIYQGRIDNSYHRVGRRRQVITENELLEVLQAITEGREIETESADSIGCYITFRKS